MAVRRMIALAASATCAWMAAGAAQKIAAQTHQFQLPSNRDAPQPPEAPRFSEMKLIDYDQVKYGSVAERKRLIARWDKDVNSIPK